MKWTELNALLKYEISATRNCKSVTAVCGLPDAKDLYYLWNAQNWQSERNFNSMRFTSNVAKSSAVILQIHVPFSLPTQYNVERSKELCFDGFNTLRGVGVGGRNVQC